MSDVVVKINTNPAEERKLRGIMIVKDELYKDIDALTYKYADASSIPSPKQENAMQSDSNENLDGRILARNIEFRDAKLRQLISFCLDDSVEILFADDMQTLDGKLCYKLSLPLAFKDALLQAIATYMHRYLVWGALYDWYGAGMGAQQANNYLRDLDSLEADITNTLRATSTVKRPMQPFGPAKRYF